MKQWAEVAGWGLVWGRLRCWFHCLLCFHRPGTLKSPSGLTTCVFCDDCGRTFWIRKMKGMWHG